jgi:hypothetical protein
MSRQSQLAPVSHASRSAARRPGLSAFGALMGGLFPISVIFSLGDIGGGLSASADDTAWLVTVYNVGQLVGQPLLMIVAGAFGRGGHAAAGAGFVSAAWPSPWRRTWAGPSPHAVSKACSAGSCRPS